MRRQRPRSSATLTLNPSPGAGHGAPPPLSAVLSLAQGERRQHLGISLLARSLKGALKSDAFYGEASGFTMTVTSHR